MTYDAGLGASLRALAAARLGIQTASQNIANANTPGYSRQRVLLASTQPFTSFGYLVGSGVQVSSIERIVDDGLIGRIAAQDSVLGAAATRFERLREIEGLFAGDGSGIADRMSDLFGSLSELQSDPGDRALRGGVVQAGAAFADAVRLIGDQLGKSGASVFDEVRGLTRSLSEKAESVATLNAEIVRLEATGARANDLRDRRDQLVRDIAGLVDVRRVEHASGSMDLIVGGRLLVAGRRADTVGVSRDAAGVTRLTIGKDARPMPVTGGRVGALLELEGGTAPELRQRLDTFVRELVLGFDRLHTTGVPGSGPLQSLVAAEGARDTNGNGVLGDELLESLGLPFPIAAGELWVRMTDRESGDATHHRITIDPSSTTLQEFARQLATIAHLDASVDGSGRLRLQADAGHGFDFAPALDARPDPAGLFGGAAPSVGSAGGAPFDLGAGGWPKTFTVDVDGALQTVTLEEREFANPSRATAAEVAAAISADLTNARALAVGERVVIQANAGGRGATLAVADGANGPLAALGIPTGSYAGRERGVQVTVSGSYDGATNRTLNFVARGDGEIGVTPGLLVDVVDASGRTLATLDVGAGYDGRALQVADGIRVSFGNGSLRGSANETFALDAIADPDTADVLVALGLNTFFTGATAETLRVNPDLVADPRRLAAGRDGAAGGSENLVRFAALERTPLAGLGGNDLAGEIAGMLADVGFETSRARATLDTQETVTAFLEEQRLSVSGVDLDEEMLDLVAWEQAFEAASRLVSVVQEMTDTLMRLGAP